MLSPLPPELQALYENTVNTVVSPTAYESFQAVPPPWKICFIDAYQGNAWRVETSNLIKSLVDQLNAAGKPSTLTVYVGNNDIALQNSQFREAIASKCSAIFTFPSSTTAFNDAIKAAFDAGIPVVAGTVTSPYAINFDANYYLWGADMIDGIAKALNGKGNIVMVGGIAGAPVAVGQIQGAKEALKKYPDLKVVAEVNGDWTASVTKTAVLNVLATHPEQIDAVWTTGSELKTVADAFTQAGRPIPLLTGSLTGDFLGYWKDHQDIQYYGSAILPSWNATVPVRIVTRILEGQHPKISTIMVPLPQITTEDLPGWVASHPCFTPDSSSLFPIETTDAMPEDTLNKYFTNGSATTGYDFAKLPNPCGN